MQSRLWFMSCVIDTQAVARGVCGQMQVQFWLQSVFQWESCFGHFVVGRQIALTGYATR